MAHVDLTHSSDSSDTDNDSDIDVKSLRAELVRLHLENQSLLKNNLLLRNKNEELCQRISTLKEKNEDVVASARSRAKQAYRAEQHANDVEQQMHTLRLSMSGNVVENCTLKNENLVLTHQRDEAKEKLKAAELDKKLQIAEAVLEHESANNTVAADIREAKNIICSSIEALRTTGIRPEFLLQQMEKATDEMVQINNQQKLKYAASNARAEAAEHDRIHLGLMFSRKEKENNSLKDVNDTLLQRIRDMQV